jgi:hypothetical protein
MSLGKKGEEPYLAYFTAIKRAKAEGLAKCCAAIMKAVGEGTWQAAAWRLERALPKFYGSDKLVIRELIRRIEQLEKERVCTGRTPEGASQPADEPIKRVFLGQVPE